MGTRRNVLIGLTVLCALGSTAALASLTTCPTGPLVLYLVPNSTCSTGAVTYSSFGFSGAAPGLNASQITVTPITTDYKPGFMFSGNFVVAPGINTAYMFSYFIDPPPIIHGEQLDLDPIGSVAIIEDFCVGGPLIGCPPGNQQQLQAVPGNLTVMSFFAPTNAIGVNNTFTLMGGTNGASSQGFDNISLLVTPEPSASLLAASGLLGLFAFRSRAKLRKIRF